MDSVIDAAANTVSVVSALACRGKAKRERVNKNRENRVNLK